MIIGHDHDGYSDLGLPVIPDLRPGEGSLGGLLTALRHSDARRTFCVACDMPFLKPAVVEYFLREAGGDWEVVIPRLPEGLEPLCAVYSVNLAPRIEGLLDRGEKRIRTLIEGSRTRYVDVDELRPLDPRLLTFVNINTPDDLKRVTTVEEGVRG
jgi:molybdopterin-guanine dinucleotide biosynthesis protein A